MLQRAMVKKKKKKHATDDNADCRLEDCKKKKRGGQRCWGSHRRTRTKKPRWHSRTQLIDERVRKKDTLFCDPDDTLTRSTTLAFSLSHSFTQPTHSANSLARSSLHSSQSTLHVVHLNYLEASRPAGTRFPLPAESVLQPTRLNDGRIFLLFSFLAEHPCNEEI